MSDEQRLPDGWVWTTLGDVRLDLSSGMQPAYHPETLFELYSVPSYDNDRPEFLYGQNIGSNKQIITPGTVLLCKINPHINRAWVVGNYSEHEKIASTEWIPFFPLPDLDPKYLRYYLSLNTV
ncbi:MAG: restriction endonuclease, partial [Ktedonobacterales bacterium]